MMKPPAALEKLTARARSVSEDGPPLRRMAGDVAVAAVRGDLNTLRALRAALAAAASAPPWVDGYRAALADVAAALEREIGKQLRDEELVGWLVETPPASSILRRCLTTPQTPSELFRGGPLSLEALARLRSEGLVEKLAGSEAYVATLYGRQLRAVLDDTDDAF